MGFSQQMAGNWLTNVSHEILLGNCYQIIQNKEIIKINIWASAVAYRHALTINNF